MSFDGFLEQSVTITISLGPFVDKDDGDTEKTGLTIEDTDVYLSKNGGAKANPNDTNNCTEDANGVYRKQLNGTDIGTVGRLAVYCHFTDCLYIRQNYIVLDPESYAGFVTGTAFGTDDKILVSTNAQDLSSSLDVNVKTITAGIIANASFNSDVGSTVYASNIIALAVRKVLDEVNLDHFMKTAVANNADMTTEVTDGTVLSNIMSKTSDTSSFGVANDSLEAQADVSTEARLAELDAANVPAQATQAATGVIHIPAHGPTQWFVDGINGDDGNSGTTVDDAFETIGQALSALSDGDLLSIFPGGYTENINITNDFVTIVGVGRVLINSTSGTAVTISGNYCSIANLTIWAHTSLGTGLAIATDKDFNIVENCFVAVAQNGFTVGGVDNQLIDCVAVSDYGFRVTSFTNSFLRCRAHGRGNAGVGFWVETTDADRNFFRNCDSVAHTSWGFRVIAGANNNLFAQCSSGGGDGPREDLGTNNSWPGWIAGDAAEASVTTEARLAQLDEANMPGDIDALTLASTHYPNG